ncbi:MAG: Gfo/Idh/MocA family oxidoreductase [Bryobacteraceae bacterium]|nr:Gfo/Idh/MocA family oxidoreductase [Bryobacteraceae bacterium]
MEESRDVSRRDVVMMAGAATAAAAINKFAAAPGVQTVHAANDVVNYAVIGTGGRGSYLIRHFNSLDGGRCIAVCDIDDEALKNGVQTSKDKPQGYKDYREVLARQDIDAVVVSVPLYMHFPVTRDALEAGKHVFCEKSLVFTPEEVHALRAMVQARPKQVLQTGLQRRYSRFYRTAKQMVDKGMIGEITHIRAQWHRKNLGKTWRPPSWRVYRKYSGGLTAELASHQIDIASWMFGAEPEFVVGVGGIDTYKDGRDTYDNIQLIYSYPRGRKLMYSSISTNNHLSLFHGERNEFGEIIMGTGGTIHITVGSDNEPALGMWFYEPQPEEPKAAEAAKEKPAIAGATLASTGKGRRGWPILFDEDMVTGKESFLAKEMKFARMWLYQKGVMVPEEINPVDTQLLDFFDCVRTGKHPVADLEIGLADSTSVILSNLAMDEGRRVYTKEIETLGRGATTPESKPEPGTGVRRT